MNDVIILTATHAIAGGFGALLLSVRSNATADRRRIRRAAVSAWKDAAVREAELDRMSNPNRYPLDHPGFVRLGIELGLVCPPDAADLVAEQNRKAAESVIDLRDLKGGAS